MLFRLDTSDRQRKGKYRRREGQDCGEWEKAVEKGKGTKGGDGMLAVKAAPRRKRGAPSKAADVKALML